MSLVGEVERQRREKVLQNLNRRLKSASTAERELGIEGSKVTLQHPYVHLRGNVRLTPPLSQMHPGPQVPDAPSSVPTQDLSAAGVLNPPTTGPSLIPMATNKSLKATAQHARGGGSSSLMESNSCTATQEHRPSHARDGSKKIHVLLKAREGREVPAGLAGSRKQPTLLLTGGGQKKVSKENLRRRQVPDPSHCNTSKKPTLQSGAVKRSRLRPPKKEIESLKDRVLGEKYGRVWLRRVFGRVSPSRARAHRHRALKRRVCVAWQEEWWASRREWKLNIRAECHDRYRLWQLVWKHWSEYISLARRKAGQRSLADSHAAKRLQRGVWSSWKAYCGVRRGEKVLKDTADRFSHGRTLKWAWSRWRDALKEERRQQVLDAVAMRHWSNRLQKQAWKKWEERYLNKAILNRQMAVARQHCRRALVLRCWWAWQHYLEGRRELLHMRGVALEFHHSCIVSRTFQRWRDSYERSVEMAQFQELVTEKGAMAKTRRAFLHWKKYLAQVQHKAHLKQLADCHYASVLKRCAFCSLSEHASRQQRQRDAHASAYKFSSKKRLFHSWMVWLHRCDHRDEIRMLPQTRRARGHHGRVLLKKSVSFWKRFVLYRRDKRSKREVADYHFEKVALPRYFEAFKECVSIGRYKKELGCVAVNFRRETLLSMAFYHWWRASHFSQDMRMWKRMAILHSEEKVKRKSMTLWRKKTKVAAKTSQMEYLAVHQYERNLLSCSLGKWSLAARLRMESTRQAERALNHCNNRLVRKALDAWKLLANRRKASQSKKTFSLGHYQRALAKKMLREWKEYHRQALRKKRRVSMAVSLYHTSTMRHMLRVWSEKVQLLRASAEKKVEASFHWRLTIARKCFGAWRDTTRESVREEEEEELQAGRVGDLLNRAKLTRLFSFWRDCTQRLLAEREEERRADSHYSRRTLSRCFAAWESHYRLCLKKMLMQRQCRWFQDTRVLSWAYSWWRVEFMKSVAGRKAVALSLWHWSQTLQRKVLLSWLLYTINRKRKAQRYSMALSRYRQRLLSLGVTQWIKVGTTLQAERREVALRRQTKSVGSVFQCVHRCALRWRRAARHRGKLREEREGRGGGGGGGGWRARERRPHTIGQSAWREGDELWDRIARKWDIPEVMSSRRLLPRRPDFLASDAAVQEPLHYSPPPHPPSPHSPHPHTYLHHHSPPPSLPHPHPHTATHSSEHSSSAATVHVSSTSTSSESVPRPPSSFLPPARPQQYPRPVYVPLGPRAGPPSDFGFLPSSTTSEVSEGESIELEGERSNLPMPSDLLPPHIETSGSYMPKAVHMRPLGVSPSNLSINTCSTDRGDTDVAACRSKSNPFTFNPCEFSEGTSAASNRVQVRSLRKQWGSPPPINVLLPPSVFEQAAAVSSSAPVAEDSDNNNSEQVSSLSAAVQCSSRQAYYILEDPKCVSESRDIAGKIKPKVVEVSTGSGSGSLLDPSSIQQQHRHRHNQTVTADTLVAGIGGVGDRDLSSRLESEVMRVRDELRSFHQLKTRKRNLEELIGEATRRGQHKDIVEHQRELSQVDLEIQSREPKVMSMATRINSLLSHKCSLQSLFE